MQPTYDAIVGLTDAFCGKHVSAEYRDLARGTAAASSRQRPSPLAAG